MTSEYAIALEVMREAQRKFDAVKAKYRSQKIGDAKFLEAFNDFKLAERIFDKAYAKEAA